MAINPRRQLGGAPGNLNEELFDALVRHQIGLLRYSGRVRNRIFEILDATETDIAGQIRNRLRSVTAGFDRPATVRRLRSLRNTIRTIRERAWREAARVWREETMALTGLEVAFLAEAFRRIAPVQLDINAPPASALNGLVATSPFEGRVMAEWARSIARADLERILDQVTIGLAQGESSNAIARRVVGTARLRGTNGVTEISRRQANAITRTAVNHFSNAAKQQFYAMNSDIITQELYVATLDARTTPVCRGYDGEFFPVGEGPIPPLHFNCRSLRVAMLDGDVLGTRPAKTSTQKDLLRRYAEQNGLKTVPRRALLPRGHKGRFDAFARGEIRRMTGIVDAKISYQQWLGRQSAAFQDDVLGKTRGRLFRRGGIDLDRFVDSTGRTLTLKELANNDKNAVFFNRSNLMREDFR